MVGAAAVTRNSRRNKSQQPDDDAQGFAPRQSKKRRTTNSGGTKSKAASNQAEGGLPQTKKLPNIAETPRQSKKMTKMTGPLPSSGINTLATGSTKVKRKSTGHPNPPLFSASKQTPPATVFCCLPPDHVVDYKMIVDKCPLVHPAWSFVGNDSHKFRFLRPGIVGTGSVVSIESHRRLRQDITICEAQGREDLLYMTDELIDLFNQFTHRGENFQETKQDNDSALFLPMPSQLFTRIKGNKFNFETDTVASGFLKHIGADLFRSEVIVFIIHGEFHYSIAFVVNAGAILDRTFYTKKGPSDRKPAIIIANTIPSGGGGSHDPDFLASRIRRFLNQVQKHYGLGGAAGVFKTNTMEKVVIKAPKQQRGWTCGLHCMAMTHLMRQFHKSNGPITYGNIDELEKQLHHSPEDALILRSDLLKLVNCLVKGGDPRNSIESVADDVSSSNKSSRRKLFAEEDTDLRPAEENSEVASAASSGFGVDFDDDQEGHEEDGAEKDQCDKSSICTEDLDSLDDDRRLRHAPGGLLGPRYGGLRIQRQPRKGRGAGRRQVPRNVSCQDATDNEEDESETIRDLSRQNRIEALERRRTEQEKQDLAYIKSVRQAQEKKKHENWARMAAEEKENKENMKKKIKEKSSIGNGRVMGQVAASVRQVKDKSLRSQAKRVFESSRNCHKMGQYGTETMNKTCPKFQQLSFTVDMIVPQPSKAQGNLNREKAAISCVGPDDEGEMKKTLDFIIANRDSIELFTDQLAFDKRHFGVRRPVTRRGKKENIDGITTRGGNKEHFENSKSTADLCSPTPNKNKKPTKVKVQNSRLLALAKPTSSS